MKAIINNVVLEGEPENVWEVYKALGNLTLSYNPFIEYYSNMRGEVIEFDDMTYDYLIRAFFARMADDVIVNSRSNELVFLLNHWPIADNYVLTGLCEKLKDINDV